MSSSVIRGLKLILSNLEVHADQMQKNLEISAEQVFSEGVMLALAKKLGQNPAHPIIFKEAKSARNKGVSFRELILSNPEISSHLSNESIEEIFSYKNSLGLCTAMIDKVLDRI